MSPSGPAHKVPGRRGVLLCNSRITTLSKGPSTILLALCLPRRDLRGFI